LCSLAVSGFGIWRPPGRGSTAGAQIIVCHQAQRGRSARSSLEIPITVPLISARNDSVFSSRKLRLGITLSSVRQCATPGKNWRLQLRRRTNRMSPRKLPRRIPHTAPF
jgi:hypothetical protein